MSKTQAWGQNIQASRTMLYIGGLSEEVTDKTLMDVFSPFGDILAVEVVIDPQTLKAKGYGFVTFQTEEDAADAIDNMDQSELFGRVLRVNVARANKMGEKAMAIWDTDRDAYQNALDADREAAMAKRFNKAAEVGGNEENDNE